MSYIVERAEELAREWHKDQKYGDQPYTAHLERVVQIMRQILALEPMLFFNDEVGIAGGWLHDSLEDTKLPFREIEVAVGYATATLVNAVTDSPGPNRAARKKNTYPKIRAAGPLAVALKLADRIANVEKSMANKSEGLFRMYQKEQAEFAGALYRYEDGLDSVWTRLEDLLKS